MTKLFHGSNTMELFLVVNYFNIFKISKFTKIKFNQQNFYSK